MFLHTRHTSCADYISQSWNPIANEGIASSLSFHHLPLRSPSIMNKTLTDRFVVGFVPVPSGLITWYVVRQFSLVPLASLNSGVLGMHLGMQGRSEGV